MKKLILLFLLVSACTVKEKCNNPIKGKAVLVAYRVAKHSHMWLLNPETNVIYDIGSLGGRREPTIDLGDTIIVNYCNGDIMFDKYSYVQYPVNKETRYVYKDGYNNLY